VAYPLRPLHSAIIPAEHTVLRINEIIGAAQARFVDAGAARLKAFAASVGQNNG
jgi:hypothetical protein